MKHRMLLIAVMLLALALSASAQSLVRFCDLGPNGEDIWTVTLNSEQLYCLKADPEWFPDPGDTMWKLYNEGGTLFTGVHITKPSPYDYYFTVPQAGAYLLKGNELNGDAIRVNLWRCE